MSERTERYQVQRRTIGGWYPEAVSFTQDTSEDPKQAAIAYAQQVFRAWWGKQQVRVQRIETETVYDSGEPA